MASPPGDAEAAVALRVGFIGAGRLGQALAWSLAHAGLRVVAVSSMIEAHAQTLAERIAARCLSFPGVQAVELALHKPEAPVGVPASDVVLRIVRERG